jgi:hypothetical protein
MVDEEPNRHPSPILPISDLSRFLPLCLGSPSGKALGATDDKRGPGTCCLRLDLPVPISLVPHDLAATSDQHHTARHLARRNAFGHQAFDLSRATSIPADSGERSSIRP